MARVVPGGDCRSIQLGEGGPVIHRQRDGAFHVETARAARLIAEGCGGFVAGTRVGGVGESEPTGPWCEHGVRPFYCEKGCK